MKRAMVFLVAALSAGCAITDYPVMFDTRGNGQDQIVETNYGPAYVRPSLQVAYVWDDGTDETFTLVSQDWMGDQWLKNYDNFDPTSSVVFLDQTYCDPAFYAGVLEYYAIAWNPDLPNAYPHGGQGAGYGAVDDPFDYLLNPEASGARSLSMLLAMTSRLGECGSGIWYDKQALYYEFSLLEKVNWHGRPYYVVPIDSATTSVRITGEDGAVADMPIFGSFRFYADDKIRMCLPVTPNARYQLQWLANWTGSHGNFIDGDLTFGSLTANFKIKVTPLAGPLSRL